MPGGVGGADHGRMQPFEIEQGLPERDPDFGVMVGAAPVVAGVFQSRNRIALQAVFIERGLQVCGQGGAHAGNGAPAICPGCPGLVLFGLMPHLLVKRPGKGVLVSAWK